MEQAGFVETSGRNEAHSSGVSWAAVIAGAFVSAALSLALLALGAGIGFSAVSPWPNAGASASMIGWTAIAWLVLMQVIASSIAGYLAGRLRTKWVNVHTHEVYFRDTAHGFLVWAVGLVITAAFLTTTAAALVGGAANVGAAALNADQARENSGPSAYVTDTLLRTTSSSSRADDAPARREVGVIFANGLRTGSLPGADRAYLAQMVATRTGISQAESEQRVDAAYSSAGQVADATRRAIAHSMYWTFLALLVGAFCASFAATLGGKERDRVVAR